LLGLTLNHDPPNICLYLSSEDYRYEATIIFSNVEAIDDFKKSRQRRMGLLFYSGSFCLNSANLRWAWFFNLIP
jgi:hypothetical protein